MDKMQLIYLLAAVFFILLGILLNCSGKNKKGIPNDSNFANKNSKKGEHE
jgi:uncharacterized membrane protein YhaH (DUF805 family)